MVWFAAGAAAGAYVLTRARRAAEVLTSDGLADRLAGWSVGLALFREEVRAGAAERENDLRHRLGLPLPGRPPQLTAGAAAGAASEPDTSAETREATT